MSKGLCVRWTVVVRWIGWLVGCGCWRSSRLAVNVVVVVVVASFALSLCFDFSKDASSLYYLLSKFTIIHTQKAGVILIQWNPMIPSLFFSLCKSKIKTSNKQDLHSLLGIKPDNPTNQQSSFHQTTISLATPIKSPSSMQRHPQKAPDKPHSKPRYHLPRSKHGISMKECTTWT